MDAEILKILSEELRETRMMVIETRSMAEAAQKTAVEAIKSADAAINSAGAAIKSADAAAKRADAAWELVVMTRNQIREELSYMRLPWWKKLSGKAA